jgi:shikimate dehydrogenase
VSDVPEDAAADQYGVVGHPIGHSWSPFIHGMFAKETSQHMVYRLFDIPPEDFRREVLRLFTSGVAGLNVTIPHKQVAAELVNELTPRAARAKAVNTIALFKKSGLIGDNTDGVGLLTDLEQNLGLDLAQKKVLILGAGGAARGTLGPLLERDLKELVIANRTPGRARRLAVEFSDLGNVHSCGFAEIEGPPFDLIINATAASLQGEMPPMPAGLVGEETVCYDMAYGRGETPFTLWAQSLHAAHTSKGWGMLVEQAAASFELWRGVRPSTRPVLEVLTQFR